VKGGDFWTREKAPMQAAKDKLTMVRLNDILGIQIHFIASQIPQIQEGMKNMFPLKRLTEASDVSNAIVFLASEKSSFINGALLPVDGGKVLTAKGYVDDKPQF
jgi:NAD(P)-dependent dehydrogenase (short-subunit alcohol dehydrogenase family)